MSNKEDLILLQRVQLGDKEAYGILFHKYYSFLCFLSKRYTKDMSTAKEVVQEIFIYIWEHRNKININLSLKSYLSQAVKFNSIRRINNYRKNIISIEYIPDCKHDSEFNDQLEYAELQNSILQAIESLPSQCQKVFEMSRFEKLSYREISASLNISVKTVEAHISKALKIINDYLLNNKEIFVFILLINKFLQYC